MSDLERLTGLSRENHEEGLRDLVAALRHSEEPVVLRLIGGAAISLVFDADRRSTVDIDGKLTPREAVIEAAIAIAAKHGDFYPGDEFTDRTARIVQEALDSGYIGRPESFPTL